MSQTILALDCGSTHFKAALFDHSLRRLAEASEPVLYTAFTNREVEMDAAQIWATTLQVLSAACDNAGVSPHDVTHISITSQAQTFGVFDPHGQALTPFYSWLDKRAETEAGVLREKFGAILHQHCSFPDAVPQLHLSKLLWLRREHPARLPDDSFIWPLLTYIAWKLAGTPVMDDNLAAMSGLYSLQRQSWWSEALELCVVSPAQLPELMPVGAAVGARRGCDELPLREDLIIVSAGNDQTSGAVGNNCLEDSLIITLGTALVVYRYAGMKPGPFSSGGIWGPYPGGGYYELATRDEGCLALDWAREQLMPEADTAAFMAHAEAAHKKPERAHVRFQPQRIRTAEAWEFDSRSTPAMDDMALAVVEGINESARELLEVDLGISPHKLSSVIVIGGGSQSEVWRELLAAKLGCPAIKGEGDSLLGAARMASTVSLED